MTKQVRIRELPGMRMNESELRFLQYLGGHGDTVVASLAQMGAAIGVRPETARRTVRSLSNSGCVECHTRFLSNGGQLENEYQLTRQGRKVLDAWDAQERSKRQTAMV